MPRSKNLLDQRGARPSAEQLGRDGGLIHALGDRPQSLNPMFDQVVLTIDGDKVSGAGRHRRQDVHNLHARATPRRQADCLIEGGLIGRSGVDVDEDACDSGHAVPFGSLLPHTVTAAALGPPAKR
jgi:hypothetical protein